MELVHYLRIVRRRWLLVLLVVLLGVMAGTGTGFFRSTRNPSATFYLAKHTLSSADSAANLNRDAQLCTDGEIVAKRVAAKLGRDDANVLNAKIFCEPHPDTSLLYVAAADADPRVSEVVADTWAEELVAYLREIAARQTQDRLARTREQLTARTAELQQKTLEFNLERDPTNKVVLGQQRDDLQRQATELAGTIAKAESTPSPADSLTTLSTAESAPISASAYETLLGGQVTAKATAGNSPTQNAAKQSQIDLAVKAESSIPIPTRGAAGGALGLLLGMTLVIVLDRVDPRVRTKFEAEEAFGWPVIGEIPPLSRAETKGLVIFSYDEPRSRAAEAYRVLRSALLFVQTGGSGDVEEHPIFSGAVNANEAASTDDPSRPARTRGQVIMVTSPGPAEGKTTTAANMAGILAETGRTVLVVNCDFRRPRIHQYLGAENHPRQVIETRIPNVKLVTQVLENPDDANPALVVQTQRQVIRNARDMFDIILLDTAPLLTTNDATEVLSVADQVVVVAKTGKTHKEAADRAAELLERRSAPVIGVVLVGATDVPTSRYYYYGGNTERGEEAGSPTADAAPSTGSATGSATASANDDAPAPTTTAVPADATSAGAPSMDATSASSMDATKRAAATKAGASGNDAPPSPAAPLSEPAGGR